MSDPQHSDPEWVTGAVYAQLEDLPHDKQIKVLRDVLQDLERPKLRAFNVGVRELIDQMQCEGHFDKATPGEVWRIMLDAFRNAFVLGCHRDAGDACDFDCAENECTVCGVPK